MKSYTHPHGTIKFIRINTLKYYAKEGYTISLLNKYKETGGSKNKVPRSLAICYKISSLHEKCVAHLILIHHICSDKICNSLHQLPKLTLSDSTFSGIDNLCQYRNKPNDSISKAQMLHSLLRTLKCAVFCYCSNSWRTKIEPLNDFSRRHPGTHDAYNWRNITV